MEEKKNDKLNIPFEVPTTFFEPNNFTHYWNRIYHYAFIPNNAGVIIVCAEREEENEQRDIYKKR